MNKRFFDRNRVNSLFNLSKKCYVTTHDGYFYLYRINHENRYEIRFENEYITLSRFYLDKDITAKSKLIKILKEMGKYQEVYVKSKRG
jgi:hypothetical protein